MDMLAVWHVRISKRVDANVHMCTTLKILVEMVCQSSRSLHVFQVVVCMIHANDWHTCQSCRLFLWSNKVICKWHERISVTLYCMHLACVYNMIVSWLTSVSKRKFSGTHVCMRVFLDTVVGRHIFVSPCVCNIMIVKLPPVLDATLGVLLDNINLISHQTCGYGNYTQII